MRRQRRQASGASVLHMIGIIGLLLIAAATTTVRAQELCQQLKTCRRNGNGDCDRTAEACPSCMYNGVGNAFLCYDKSPETNTCPYTGVVYDCSGIRFGSKSTSPPSPAPKNASIANAPSLNSTSPTKAGGAATTGKSSTGLYAAIGGGVLLVVILIVVLVVRRRRRGRNMPKFADSPQVFNTKHHGKNATVNTPYTNMPTTSKGPGRPSYQRKYSDPVLESSAVMMGTHQASSDYSGNTTSDSLDGMLAMDNTPPPAVLGDPPLPRTRSKRGFSSGFKRHNSNGSTKSKSSTYDVPAPSANGANVLNEYLKMKKEHKFDSDVLSDYGSDMMSRDRFSVNSSSTVGGGSHHHGLDMSMTESEYQSDLMRSRTESECFSEMSYNDEKYSFSEDAESVRGTSSVVRPHQPKKEVEI